jgi:UDP-N-acetylglucosamine acyltransferase
MEGLNYIHPDAKLGTGVQVGAFAVVEQDVVIGEHTVVHPNATILRGSRIGSHCEIFPTAVIGAIPQDLKYKGEYTTVEIGDFTTIREGVTVNLGTTDRMKTVVGSHCLLMAYVHVAHDAKIGNHCIIANLTGIAGHVEVEDFVVIEGMVGIQQFIRIGRHSFVAGTSKVRKDIPPFVKVARDPLAYSGINSVGMRRRGMSDADISTIENIYKSIYIRNSNIRNGLKAVEEEFGSNPYAQEILNFVKRSDKGIVKGMI